MSRRAESTEPDFTDLSARVYRLCVALLGDRERARDTAQEALSRAWSRRRRKRPATTWWSWAAGFAVRVCREDARRTEAWSALGSAGDVPSRLATGDLGLVDPEHTTLHEAIQALPDRQREVTVLRFLVGLSTRGVAETLGCPMGTVKSNLHKAIVNLHGTLRSRGVADEMRRG